jgi:hypothetical protein
MICLLKYSLAAIILQRSGDVAVLLNPGPINAGNLSTHSHHPNLPNPTCHSCQAVILWEADPIFCSYCDSYYHTSCVFFDQATSGEFLDWICGECFSSSHCSFNSSTGNTTFESDLTSKTTSEDHDVISNQQDSNNFSYLKLHLPNKGLFWSVECKPFN